MNDRLEQYLNQATRGLWGRRRAEVREELEGHVLERVERYRIGGMGYAEALERSIAELGTPRHVSAGMFRLYVAPLLAGSSLVMAVLMTAVVLLVSSSVAQVEVTRTSPLPGCGTLDCSTVVESAKTWVNLTQLGVELRRQGVDVEQNADIFKLHLSNGITIDLSTPVRMKTSQNGFLVSFERDGQLYLMLGALMSELARQSQNGIKVQGISNPAIEVASVKFSFSDQQTPVNIKWDWTDAALRRLARSVLPDDDNRRLISTNMWESSAHRYSLDVAGPPGTAYIVVTRTPVPCGGQEYACLGTDIAETTGDGKIAFRNFGPSLEFTADPREFYRPSIVAPHKALLLRLTGQIDRNGAAYQIELPKTRVVSSDPAR